MRPRDEAQNIEQKITRKIITLRTSRIGISRAIGDVAGSLLSLTKFHQKHHQSLALTDRQKIESNIIITRELLKKLIKKYPDDEPSLDSFIADLNSLNITIVEPELRKISKKTKDEKAENKKLLDEKAILEEKSSQERELGSEINLGDETEEPVGPESTIARAPASTPTNIKELLDAETGEASSLNQQIKDRFINTQKEHKPASEEKPERKRFVEPSTPPRNPETPKAKRQSTLRERQASESIIQESERIDSSDFSSSEEESSDYENENERNRSNAFRQSEESEVIEQPNWLERNWKALAIATLAITLFTIATIFTFGATGIVGAGVAAAGGVWAAGWSAFPAIGAMSALTGGVVILDGIAAGITITGLLFLAKEGIKKLFSPKPPSSGSEKKSVDSSSSTASRDSEQTSRSSYNESIGNRLTLDYSRRASAASSITENRAQQHGGSQGRRYGQENLHTQARSLDSSFDGDRGPSPGRRGSR